VLCQSCSHGVSWRFAVGGQDRRHGCSAAVPDCGSGVWLVAAGVAGRVRDGRGVDPPALDLSKLAGRRRISDGLRSHDVGRGSPRPWPRWSRRAGSAIRRFGRTRGRAGVAAQPRSCPRPGWCAWVYPGQPQRRRFDTRQGRGRVDSFTGQARLDLANAQCNCAKRELINYTKGLDQQPRHR
jgi:hypothetical protein